MLKRVAQVLQKSVTSHDIIARYGGEEFTILFPEKSIDEAYLLCEQVRQAVMSIADSKLPDLVVTASIGLSAYSSKQSKSEFFAESDRLLYAAKHNGKNQITC